MYEQPPRRSRGVVGRRHGRLVGRSSALWGLTRGVTPSTNHPAGRHLGITAQIFLHFLIVVAWACGAAGPTAEEVERSRRELELAARLREEGSIPGAIEHLRLALESNPDNAEAHILMGFIKMERGEAELADESLKKGITLLEAQDRFGQRLAEAKNVRGVALLSLKRCDEAADLLRQAANDEMNTLPHLAWFNLGLAELCRKHPEQAIVALEEALRRQPQFCVGHYRLAEAYLETKNLASAERALDEAIESHPDCSERFQAAYWLRARVRRDLGREDEAVADFERCVELGAETVHGSACRGALEEVR